MILNMGKCALGRTCLLNDEGDDDGTVIIQMPKQTALVV